MKYLILFLFIATLASCSDDNVKGKTFTTDSLPTQQFTIATDRDTIIQTTYGALLKIPKGAIVSSNGTTATLEIKEAYSIEQMVMGGLTTSADGAPLSSGGMIYINSVAGQKLKITQPIKVALPTDYFTEGMQLWKGDTSNGKINWKDPKPLEETEQMKAIAAGQKLFQQNCSSCHGIGKEISGPDLAHIVKRIPWGEQYAHIWDHTFSRKQPADSASYFDLPPYFDQYTCNLIQMFGGQIGPLFPDFRQQDWKSIYDYVQTESDRLDLPLPRQANLMNCADSCEVYNEAVNRLTALKRMTQKEREEYIQMNGPMVDDTNSGSPPSLDRPTGFPDKVSPENFGAQYYQFTIETFGWFNVDVLIDNVPGVEPSELFVRIQGQYKERIEVHFILPSAKVNATGGPTEKNENEYAFYTKDGKISLPQNAKAYILAVTESGGSFAYALQSFNTSRQQTINIELKKATKKEFNAAMKVLKGNDIKIKVQDSKNAKEIRAKDADLKKIDAQLKEAEVLKPKGCDCDCGSARPAAADVTKIVVQK